MLNFLLIFVPAALVLAWSGAPAVWVFAAAALGIVPLAGWLGRATEALAARSGSAVGGLLNATFGNATELIIAFFALRAGQVEVVKASLIGSIIGNVLLVLGLAALLGGRRHPRQTFNPHNVRVLSSMFVIAILGFVVPTIFDLNERVRFAVPDAESRATDARLSLGVAVVLLALYAGNLFFSLVSHKDLVSGEETPHAPAAGGWSLPRALGVLLAATVAIGVLSEVLVGALEGFTGALGLSATFVGMIVIPVIGNAAEHASAVTFALQDKMDLSVSIALGSALQIALLVAPVLVFLSWIIGQPMDLVLRGPFELTALLGSVWIGNSVARDGETHWYEGLLLLGVYAILALAFFFTPDTAGPAKAPHSLSLAVPALSALSEAAAPSERA